MQKDSKVQRMGNIRQRPIRKTNDPTHSQEITAQQREFDLRHGNLRRKASTTPKSPFNLTGLKFSPIAVHKAVEKCGGNILTKGPIEQALALLSCAQWMEGYEHLKEARNDHNLSGAIATGAMVAKQMEEHAESNNFQFVYGTDYDGFNDRTFPYIGGVDIGDAKYHLLFYSAIEAPIMPMLLSDILLLSEEDQHFAKMVVCMLSKRGFPHVFETELWCQVEQDLEEFNDFMESPHPGDDDYEGDPDYQYEPNFTPEQAKEIEDTWNSENPLIKEIESMDLSNLELFIDRAGGNDNFAFWMRAALEIFQSGISAHDFTIYSDEEFSYTNVAFFYPNCDRKLMEAVDKVLYCGYNEYANAGYVRYEYINSDGDKQEQKETILTDYIDLVFNYNIKKDTFHGFTSERTARTLCFALSISGKQQDRLCRDIVFKERKPY